MLMVLYWILAFIASINACGEFCIPGWTCREPKSCPGGSILGFAQTCDCCQSCVTPEGGDCGVGGCAAGLTCCKGTCSAQCCVVDKECPGGQRCCNGKCMINCPEKSDCITDEECATNVKNKICCNKKCTQTCEVTNCTSLLGCIRNKVNNVCCNSQCKASCIGSPCEKDSQCAIDFPWNNGKCCKTMNDKKICQKEKECVDCITNEECATNDKKKMCCISDNKCKESCEITNCTLPFDCAGNRVNKLCCNKQCKASCIGSVCETDNHCILDDSLNMGQCCRAGKDNTTKICQKDECSNNDIVVSVCDTQDDCSNNKDKKLCCNKTCKKTCKDQACSINNDCNGGSANPSGLACCEKKDSTDKTCTDLLNNKNCLIKTGGECGDNKDCYSNSCPTKADNTARVCE